MKIYVNRENVALTKYVDTLVGIFGTLGWIPAHLVWAFVSFGNIEAISQIGGNDGRIEYTGG